MLLKDIQETGTGALRFDGLYQSRETILFWWSHQEQWTGYAGIWDHDPCPSVLDSHLFKFRCHLINIIVRWWEVFLVPIANVHGCRTLCKLFGDRRVEENYNEKTPQGTHFCGLPHTMSNVNKVMNECLLWLSFTKIRSISVRYLIYSYWEF